MIHTGEFTIAPSVTAAQLARRWLWKRWFLFVLPVGALLIMGLLDWRWLIVALMAVFILWPMALFFVWCGAALAPEAVRASRPHGIVFAERGFTIIYTPVEGYASIEPETVAWRDVADVEQDRGYIHIHTVSGRIILVPVASVQSTDVYGISQLHRQA